MAWNPKREPFVANVYLAGGKCMQQFFASAGPARVYIRQWLDQTAAARSGELLYYNENGNLYERVIFKKNAGQHRAGAAQPEGKGSNMATKKKTSSKVAAVKKATRKKAPGTNLPAQSPAHPGEGYEAKFKKGDKVKRSDGTIGLIRGVGALKKQGGAPYYRVQFEGEDRVQTPMAHILDPDCVHARGVEAKVEIGGIAKLSKSRLKASAKKAVKTAVSAAEKARLKRQLEEIQARLGA